MVELIKQLNKPSAVQRLLYTGPLAALFPFIRLTTTYLPSPPPFPPPLIAPNNLPNISRKQLIDSLSKLTSSAQQSLYTEGLVFELLMEYIGRRWRAGDKDIVEHIARKLTEVEFEVCPCQGTLKAPLTMQIQVQGDLPTMRSMVQPALQKVRFLLGFLSSTQLVLRLNALFSASLPNADRIRSDPERLIKSFIVRRLAAGNDPTLVVLDLLTSQDKINSATHRGILITSIASFGLHVETPSTTEMASGSTDTPLAPASSFGQTMPPRRATSSKIVVPFAHLASGSTDTLLAPTSPTASFGPSMSPRRATFSKIASKFSYKRKEPPTTNWLSHRKNSLSVSRLHLPDFNTDRRPSLPTLPTRSSPPFKPVKSPLAMASMTSIQTIRPIREERHEPETYGKGSDDSSAMELVHRILNLRFRVHTNGGWFLGTGRENARTLLRAAQDNTEGQHMIHDICALFGIILYPTPPPIPRPVTPASYGATGEPRTPSPNNWLPVAPCLVPLSFDYEGKHPFASTGDPISPLSIASFDLDEYYARMSSARSAKSSHGPRPSMGTMLSEDDIPNQSERDFRSTESRNRRRLSTGLESVFTSHTHLTGLTYGRTSRLSSYSIREATKEWPSTAMATTFSIPQVPTVTIGGLTVTDIDSDSNEEEPRPTHRHSRSRSETDLLAVIKRDSPLTSFPPRPTSLRRTRTINPRTSIHLSAWDLGLGHVTHLAPSSPASPFAFNMPTTNRWAQHAFSAPAMASAPPSPPLSPTSSIRVTPRVSAFPLPPKELPSPNSSRQIEVPSRVRSNRKYTIINGEVSPSRCDQGSEDYFNQQRESPNHNFPVPKPSGPSGSHPSMTGKSSQEKSLPVPPRTSSLYSRSSGETARLPSLEPETPLSLALSLFTSSQSENGSLVPRSNLTFREVDVVLHDMVECEKARIKSRGKQWDDPARCRIGWLMDQLGDMVSTVSRPVS